MWRRFEAGSTVGLKGTEDGVILRDEDHDAGARITLDRECTHGVSFAVTCGIYGWFSILISRARKRRLISRACATGWEPSWT